MASNNRENLPLHGVKVIDFGHYIAGPAVAMILGDLGVTLTCPRARSRIGDAEGQAIGLLTLSQALNAMVNSQVGGAISAAQT
ncbi:CoA-transferase family III [Roseibium suaedae]|uniref:CoA-transferase family III n=1 Tax=Roseibium suaedae TaxID=735517 RepID=A0A1M7PKG2_9HYPH|nr:CoA transferase [Roseibium suaedae]SHN17431.1 CoA-transferase family III [Roseibium suaedae]